LEFLPHELIGSLALIVTEARKLSIGILVDESTSHEVL
jgi:hypothetical protein